MVNQKSQFNILTLLLLTAIVALVVTLYLAHRSHREQVRVLEQQVNDMQYEKDVISILKSQFLEAQVQLQAVKSHYGPSHPEVQALNAKLQMMKEQLINSITQ